MKKLYKITTREYNRFGRQINIEENSYEGFDLQKALNAYDKHENDKYYNLFDEINVYDVPDNYEELDDNEQIELTTYYGESLDLPDSDTSKTSPDDNLYRAYDADEREIITTKDLSKAIELAKAAKGFVEINDTWERNRWHDEADFREDD